jgi:hypothetical protein
MELNNVACDDFHILKLIRVQSIPTQTFISSLLYHLNISFCKASVSASLGCPFLGFHPALLCFFSTGTMVLL